MIVVVPNPEASKLPRELLKTQMQGTRDQNPRNGTLKLHFHWVAWRFHPTAKLGNH